MTQLYVGNLSSDGDEKAIRALFSKYGSVREVLMKSGYAFVEYESVSSAEEAIRALNGTDILGHPMIVEQSHQQRISRRKTQFGRVEVTSIPSHMNLQQLESLLSMIGPVLKVEIEEGEFGSNRIVVTFETLEQAQRAAVTFNGQDPSTPKVSYIEDRRALNGMMRNGRKASPTSPSKSNSDFPLRILVPSDMVGAIIGKDGATIRGITQLTKARVDVHRRENMGSAEKAITIIGPPECCTEACYQIMKIMQGELLVTSGVLETGSLPRPGDPLPVVPLKILAHNELIGRVIGKGGNTLKRIMAESGTKITISKLKDLTAYNMERTTTILGTIENCKKAESLISAKLRASYESDMAQFIPEQNTLYPGNLNGSTSSLSSNTTPPITSSELGITAAAAAAAAANQKLTALHTHQHQHPQSLPATPTTVRTFTDLSGDHSRLTSLQSSNSSLEVNNLGGFSQPKFNPFSSSSNGSGSMSAGVGPGGQLNGFKYPFGSALDVTMDGLYSSSNSKPPGGGGGGVGVGMGGVSSSSSSLSSSRNGFSHHSNGSGTHDFSTSIAPPLPPPPAPLGGTSHSGLPPGVSLSSVVSTVSNSGGINGSCIGNNIGNTHTAGLLTLNPNANPLRKAVVEYGLDETEDVFSSLSISDLPMIAAPGYGRSRLRRSSAPTNNNPWSTAANEPDSLAASLGHALSSSAVPTSWNGIGSTTSAVVAPTTSSTGINGTSSSGAPHAGGIGMQQNGIGTHVNGNGFGTLSQSTHSSVSSIWSQSIHGSRPDSQLSSYSGSDQGFSPIYSPVNVNADQAPTSTLASLSTPATVSGDHTSFKASFPTSLTTVSETGTISSYTATPTTEDDYLFDEVTSATLHMIDGQMANDTLRPISPQRW